MQRLKVSIAGVNAETLLDKIRSYGHRSAAYVATIDDGVTALVNAARPGDLLITLGAGNVSAAAEKILQGLREKFA